MRRTDRYEKEHRIKTAAAIAAAALIPVALALLLLWALPAATVHETAAIPRVNVPEQPVPDQAAQPSPSPSAEQPVKDAEEQPAVQPEPEPEPEPEPPKDRIFTISFAGDCTLGTEYSTYGQEGTLVRVVGDDYAYPLQYAAEYFKNDDLTIVNLEGALTEYNEPREKEYRFRGPKEYANILAQGGVEMVSLANNHTMDYGSIGYADTKDALENAGVGYCENSSTAMVELDGIKIGVFASTYSLTHNMEKSLDKLREQGADIIICAFHWGEENTYNLTSGQLNMAKQAVDAGADIIFGTHPHVLQRIEEKDGCIIYYSLGNFCFGGNRDPRDKDTAIIQQQIVLTPEGEVKLGDTVIIPFRVSGQKVGNDYRPVPMEEGTEEYDRVLEKLAGTYVAPLPETPPEDSETEALP